MIIDKENYYFIAPDNKNGLSVRPPRDLYLADTFEFKVNFTVDFEKCHGSSRGIVMMNGKHLGIHIYNNLLLASVWTDKGIFETQMILDNKNIKCKFFSFHDNEIGESKLLNKYLKYVLSPGSTTLFYAHKIFKKKCIFLNLNNQNIEKKSFGKQQIRFFEKLNFTTIEPNKIYKT